jgi:hypothetical protein
LLQSLIVVKPAREISDIVTEVGLGSLNTPELVSRSRYDIGSLATAFRMRRSLQEIAEDARNARVSDGQ